MIKLKPCPFCGGMRPYTCLCGQKWAVRCYGCGALVISDSADDGGKSAARRWNARVRKEDRRTVRTCRAEVCDYRAGTYAIRCSECGYAFSVSIDSREDADILANANLYGFCPNCGKKVER